MFVSLLKSYNSNNITRRWVQPNTEGITHTWKLACWWQWGH